jgi:hypothetical protein
MRGGVAGDIDAGGIVAGADGGGERLHLAQSGNFPASGARVRSAAPGSARAMRETTEAARKLRYVTYLE